MTLLDSNTVDPNGLPLLISSKVVDIAEVDLAGTPFLSPDGSYSGFAADGFEYTSGVQQIERATWALESTSSNRGPANVLPSRFFVLLTDREAVLVDPDDLSMVLRARIPPDLPDGESVPGIFIEWVPDDSLSVAGAGLGTSGAELRRVAWADGRLAVATSSGLRFLDFRADRCWSLVDEGRFEAQLEEFSGLAFRNKSDYFSSSPVGAYEGVTSPVALAARRLAGSGYYVAADDVELFVFVWGESLSVIKSDIEGVLDLVVQPDGVLYGLRLNDSNRLEVFRSLTEWRSSPIAGSIASVALPDQAGTTGRIIVHGDYIFVAAGAGIWGVTIEGLNEVYLYGSSREETGSILPMYQALTTSGSDVDDLAVDPLTGNLGILHGGLLDVIQPEGHKNIASYSVATSPELPTGAGRIIGFRSDVPEV